MFKSVIFCLVALALSTGLINTVEGVPLTQCAPKKATTKVGCNSLALAWYVFPTDGFNDNYSKTTVMSKTRGLSQITVVQTNAITIQHV